MWQARATAANVLVTNGSSEATMIVESSGSSMPCATAIVASAKKVCGFRASEVTVPTLVSLR